MAKVDEFMAWQHTTLRAHGSMFFQTKIIRPKMTGQPINEKLAEYHGNQLKTILEQLENIWLKDEQFIAGKDLTIADLLAVTELEQPGMAGVQMCSKRVSSCGDPVTGAARTARGAVARHSDGLALEVA
ncbi:Glutathione S-transferase theta-1 [Orchesella cincta]|uniref:Glutathione S-transferase theta-1 n=1 Tax=Orchesella cincta TaxID=48709 RepID=A0A1D2NE73_ORCCI|nr:Glutathione S-transferase theta-1 [Orchesella cincta]